MTALAAGSVQDALGDVARFVPRLIGFILILVLGWLVARLLRAGVSRLLRHVGFDQAVERGGVGRLLARTPYDARGLMTNLVYYAVLLFTLQLAFGVWGPNPVSDLIAAVVRWLPDAFVAIVIIVVAAAIAAGARNLIAGALGGLSYGRLLAGVASVFIIGIGVIAALNQIGVATSVTTPVLIAVLATIGGILVVGVGGGLVRPMQNRWESWLSRAEQEVPQVRDQLRVAAEQRQAERAEAERREAEARAAAEREEAERRAAAEREEAARREAEQEAERAEAARQAAEREEAARQEAERAEVARQAAEREEAARQEAERAEAAREEAARQEVSAPAEAPKKRTTRSRTARERAEQAAAERAAAEEGKLQVPPSDEPTVALSVSRLREIAPDAASVTGDAGSGQDAERTQPITLDAEQTQPIQLPAAPADDSESTQVLPPAGSAEPPVPPKSTTRRRGTTRKQQ